MLVFYVCMRFLCMTWGLPLTISEKNVKSVFYVLATTFSAQRI